MSIDGNTDTKTVAGGLDLHRWRQCQERQHHSKSRCISYNTMVENYHELQGAVNQGDGDAELLNWRNDEDFSEIYHLNEVWSLKERLWVFFKDSKIYFFRF